MKKTGAWLARFALEQMGIRYTLGIPGVHNTELYDELSQSQLIQPLLVTHEASAAFMADAISRTSDDLGTLVIVPAAGAAYASAGIGEAFLAGIPMLVISGGIRTDLPYNYQIHEIDQLKFLGEITKRCFRITQHCDVIPTLYEAYAIANKGEPGPVLVEIPVNIQLIKGEIDTLPEFKPQPDLTEIDARLLDRAAQLLASAKKPGIFLGWGARDCGQWIRKLAEWLDAPVATTLQGLSVFPANHPLHAGMGIGEYAVPAAASAFADCDCLLAIGTRFSEIATGSFGAKVPSCLIHIDINPNVFHVNYPAEIAIAADAREVCPLLLSRVHSLPKPGNQRTDIRQHIRRDKEDFAKSWQQHDSGDRVNPYLFFKTLRLALNDMDFMVADDGNHTYLAAELMPINYSRRFISPTDFNCMGYAVPAAIGVKLVNPDHQVVAIVGDGAFAMTCMEIATATALGLGLIFFVFNDGELGQIAQMQALPYNRKSCSVIAGVDIAGVAKAVGARFLALEKNDEIQTVLEKALQLSLGRLPVVVDVNIDYSRRTRFTEGILRTNLGRFDLGTKARLVGRALSRKMTH